jgi:cell division transport system permease protein
MLILTLAALNILLVLNLVTNAAIQNVENRVDISVTFKTTAQFEDVENTAVYLRSFAEVRDVSIVTPDEALDIFKDRHANNPTVLSSLDEVGENPFGHELVIRARSTDDYPMIMEALDNPAFRDQIEEKDFASHEEVLNKISDVANQVRLFALVLVAIFLGIAVLIVFNTVRVAIFVHREEIAIMRLVGATGWFIRAPYLLETLMFSFLAVVISGAFMIFAATALDPVFASYFDSSSKLKDFFISQGAWVYGLEFAGAALVCLVSTAVAMRKYLRV